MKKLHLLTLLTLMIGACSSAPSISEYKVYLDKNDVSTDTFRFITKDVSAYALSENYRFTLQLSIKNLSSSTQSVSFKNMTLVRESTGASYKVESDLYGDYQLDSEIEHQFNFYSTIPTALNENYYFSVDVLNTRYKVFLYETPDEFREKIDVVFYVDGTSYIKQIPYGRKLLEYEWISDDYIYGCENWYFDSPMTKVVSNYYTVTESIAIYGSKNTILRYNLPEGINASYVSGYNFIPHNGEVVVPRSYGGLSIYSILAGSFRNNVSGMKKIYIPRISSISSVYNFSSCVDLEYVYFEGTEEEWSTINEAIYPTKTKIVFGTYK